MKNGDTPAYPLGEDLWVDPIDTRKGTYMPEGLTKREAFAMAAMQGICANSAITESLLEESKPPADQVARIAVVTADALLKALEVSE